MKLRADRVNFLSNEILKILESEGFINVWDPENAHNFLVHVITDDLQVEDRLDKEVREILEQYAEKMDQDRIQYHQMFKMVKEKLAKERNLIL